MHDRLLSFSRTTQPADGASFVSRLALNLSPLARAFLQIHLGIHLLDESGQSMALGLEIRRRQAEDLVLDPVKVTHV